MARAFKPKAWLCLLLALSNLHCSGTRSSAATAPHRADGTTRYRLLLRANPLDPGEAFRCYGRCQAAQSPRAYLDCLSQCPGFEVTPDEYCSNTEVPPIAACLTVRKIPKTSEPEPGMVVLAVVGSFLLVVGASALCSSSRSQCGYYYPNYPY